MKVGIVGAGAVGTACAKSLLLRGSCHEIVLLDINTDRSTGVATDLSHGAPLCPSANVRSGDYKDFREVAAVIVTAGINEKTGGAIDRKDTEGRLRLLPDNAEVYNDVIPRIARVTPDAPIIVVTDPPDPLADVALSLVDTNPVISAGTFLDSLRFQVQLARHLKCHPGSVDALVIGEHGTSQVYVWSSARIGGELVLDRVIREKIDPDRFRSEIEANVKHANINIIEGTGASQHGIGIVAARIVEAILRNEGFVAPVGTYHADHGVTLSLPSVISRKGVTTVLNPNLSKKETAALRESAAAISNAMIKYLPDQLLKKIDDRMAERKR